MTSKSSGFQGDDEYKRRRFIRIAADIVCRLPIPDDRNQGSDSAEGPSGDSHEPGDPENGKAEQH